MMRNNAYEGKSFFQDIFENKGLVRFKRERRDRYRNNKVGLMRY
jgi:hypothetical protein